MGRPAKPTALKLIDGNPGKRPINNKEPQINSNLRDLPPPSEMSPKSKKIWKFILNEMPPTLFKTVDLGELRSYCIAYDLYTEAYKQVKKQGLIVKSPVKGEPMQNPYLSILNRQADIMQKHASNLGLTPTARTKLQVTEEPKKNKFLELLQD